MGSSSIFRIVLNDQSTSIYNGFCDLHVTFLAKGALSKGDGEKMGGDFCFGSCLNKILIVDVH